jgi:hypothetical protein
MITEEKEETIEDHQEIIENQEKTGIITILLKTKISQ